MSGPFDAFLSRAASDCVNAVNYPEPDDESGGLHDGPCEREGGYDDDGQGVRCVLCLAALKARKAGR